MKRQTPRNFLEIVALGQRSLKGLAKLEEVLGVRANTGAIMAPVVEAASANNLVYRSAISAAVEATAEQQRLLDKAATFITLVRENLKPTFGSRYHETWGVVGFVNRTLSVPRTMEQRLSLLKAMEPFFTKHPQSEIPNVVTAQMAGSLFVDLVNAMGAATAAKVAQRQTRKVRDAAVTLLRQRLQGLRAELKLLLAPNDPRWLDFGFKVPADVSVPSAPEGLEVTLDAGQAKASWGHTVHADRYRVYQRVVGTDAEPVLVGTTAGTSFDLGIFAPGAQVEVEVTAVNAAGESVRSDVVQFVFRKDE